jgi:DNA mismatch repair protein MutL
MGEPDSFRTIHILDPATVNSIAAGEIVERPVSVVKELVENAIDAGAQTIRIEVVSSGGAIKSIRVIDDGTGMSPGDAVLAFTPHATSKIHTIADLDTIRTLGFRGEALASIAAVSKISLSTKKRGSGAVGGTKVVIEGGVIREHGETGTPEGTTVVVQDLFYNIPARKKFLKSLNTEISHITGVVEGLALAHPQIAFHYSHNGSEHLATERSTRLLDTIARIFGAPVANDLIAVHHELQFMSVSGYISPPSFFRKNQSRMLVSINGRYVSSPPVNAAILEGYGTLLSKERFPLTFLSLEINTALVDINVHPTKKQVRLSREPEIRAAVRESVATALLTSDLIPTILPKESPVFGPPLMARLLEKSYIHTPFPAFHVREPTHEDMTATEHQLRQTELSSGVQPAQSIIPEMDVIGQFGGIYILAATPAGDLILIDQHAAHERVMYELVSAQAEHVRRSQELLEPVILHRNARDAAVLRELLPSLGEEGFFIEEFGRDSFLVRAVPVVLGRLEQTDLINEIMDDLTHEDLQRTVSRREQITRIIACRGAIKAGTVCTGEQCRRLLQQLQRTKNPFSCPHGRPTMVRFSREHLDAMFSRT